tara:strand:- start:412 stop:528 length:117 start_codon:yes stop_codon:yes gene_type:complete
MKKQGLLLLAAILISIAGFGQNLLEKKLNISASEKEII